jgi:hypothetical protein
MKPTNQGRTNNYFDQRFDKQPQHWNGTFPGKIKPMANPNGKTFKWQVGPINNYHWLRHGYCRPGNFWADWFFGYAYYVFDPIPWQCVFSPYYYYYCVPGYLPYRRVWCTNYRVIYIIIDPIDWRYCGNGYGYGFYSSSYGSNYDDSGNYSNLDKALSDLTDAFKYGDPTKLDRLVPRGGDVEVFIDGDYSYTVNSDEYYDITSDLIQGVHTTDFRITKVNALKNGGYFVVARHDYLDAWDNPQTNWLTFTIEESANWYAITQAGTNRNQP